MKVTDIRSRVIAVDASPSFPPGGRAPGQPDAWEYLLTTVSTDEGIQGHSMLWGLNREGRGWATSRAMCSESGSSARIRWPSRRAGRS